MLSRLRPYYCLVGNSYQWAICIYKYAPLVTVCHVLQHKLQSNLIGGHAEIRLLLSVNSGHRSGEAVRDFYHGFHAPKGWRGLRALSDVPCFQMGMLKPQCKIEGAMCASSYISPHLLYREIE